MTFFVPTVIGYIAWPQAILARGLASALAERGHDIRVVEQRRNPFYTATLRTAGSTPARRFFEDFRQLQHHTYEPRSGTHLLEWVSREIALIDVAVAVDGIEPELAGWLANLTRDGLTRVWVALSGSAGSLATVGALQPELFDAVLTPWQVEGLSNWLRQPLTIAEIDRSLAPLLDTQVELVAPDVAAEAFEHAMSVVRATRG